MFEYVKPKGFSFTLKHLGILISLAIAGMDIYSVYAFFAGIKIYPFNFIFWWSWIGGIAVCALLPILVYFIFFVISIIGTLSCKPKIVTLFDGEPENVKYYVGEKRTGSHYKIELSNEQFVRIKKAEITYSSYPDVVVNIQKLIVKEPLNFFQRFCLGPVDNQINVEMILPKNFLDKPEEYITFGDGSLKQFDDTNVKYKKEYTLKKDKNTYAFMDKVNEFLETEKQERKEAKKTEGDKKEGKE